MAAPKYLRIDDDNNGADLEMTAAVTATANAIVATNSAGYIDPSFIQDSEQVKAIASEALTAGAMVNIWNNAGASAVRLADNTNGRAADGFVISAVASGSEATVYTGSGINTAVSGLTIGSVYFLGSAGAVTSTVPTTSGYLLQPVGKANAAGVLIVKLGEIRKRA